MRPTATSTPTPTLIKRNQRYAGNQIAVAATIAAATTSAAVPRIGTVIGVGYAGSGLILTSLTPQIHVAGTSAMDSSPVCPLSRTGADQMLEVIRDHRCGPGPLPAGPRRLHPEFAAAELGRCLLGVRGNGPPRRCAHLCGQLALKSARHRGRSKTGRGQKTPGATEGGPLNLQRSLLVCRRGLRGATGQRRRNGLSGFVDDLR